jgi:hypothetical protein
MISMNVVRWIAVLPVSFACGVFAALIALILSRGITVIKVITGLVAGAVFVGVGGFVAPDYKLACMIALAMINGVYSLSQAQSLTLAPGERIDWLSLSRALGGLLPACQF